MFLGSTSNRLDYQLSAIIGLPEHSLSHTQTYLSLILLKDSVTLLKVAECTSLGKSCHTPHSWQAHSFSLSFPEQDPRSTQSEWDSHRPDGNGNPQDLQTGQHGQQRQNYQWKQWKPAVFRSEHTHIIHRDYSLVFEALHFNTLCVNQNNVSHDHVTDRALSHYLPDCYVYDPCLCSHDVMHWQF